MYIVNTDSTNYVIGSDNLTVVVSSDSLNTVLPGTIRRLAPGQSQVVQVGVTNKPGVAAGTPCSATIAASYGNSAPAATLDVSGECGIGDYQQSADSLDNHWNPEWFNNVKYGIFIHWGLYAAPAYGSEGTNENYAEWYVLIKPVSVKKISLTYSQGTGFI